MACTSISTLAIRTMMPDVPKSYSYYMPNSSYFLVGKYFADQSAQGMQFHDYHPYNSQNNLDGADQANPSAFPTAAHPSVLESRVCFLGIHIIGECGFQRRNTDANKQAFYNGLIGQGTRAKSISWVVFGEYDYNSSYEHGDYGVRQDTKLTKLFVIAPNYSIG